MKNEIVANSCRVCLTKTKKLRSLYKPVDEGDEPPNRMLHLITGIKVEKIDEYDMLPKNICKNCELSLNMAFEFRENALRTQEIIEEYLKELHEKDSSKENQSSESVYKSEYEESIDLEPLDCVEALEEDNYNLRDGQHKYSEDDTELNEGDQNEDISQETNENNDEFYKQQNTYLMKGYNENTNETYDDDEQGNEENKRTMSTDEEKVEYTEEKVEIMQIEENYTLNQRSFTKIKDGKSVKKKISKTSSKLIQPKNKLSDNNLTENIKLIPRRGRKPSNNNQNGHICDICGNVFAKRGRMMEHRQRHDKECRFGCEICEKKFLTRELLRKHMFSHCGGKPLKCEFCSRTFYYESVRKAHEAVHKGLRPYICDVCGKGFSYAHALKKHELIHAEIKLFRCEYCNKDFRLQHHMKQHELTKLHQTAVRFAKSGNASSDDCGETIREEEEDLNEDILFIEEVVDDQIAGCS